MSKTERHLSTAQGELAMAHLSALQEHDRETEKEVRLVESAVTNILELLKRKRNPFHHPG